MAKMRSPNYPAIGLSQAIKYVRQLWDKEKRTPVPPDVAVKALGYKALNGPSRTAISALRKYGLVEEGGIGVKVSDLAMTILHDPNGSPAWQKAIRDAAFRPDIFREIYTDYADASDDALRGHLLKKEFSPSGANQFITAFRDTLALVKTLDPGYIKDKGTQEEEKMSNGSEGQTTTAKAATGVLVAPPRPVLATSFPIPLRNQKQAVIGFSALPLDKSDLDLLKRWIDLMADNLTEVPDKKPFDLK